MLLEVALSVRSVPKLYNEELIENDCEVSVEKKSLVVSLKGLGAKTNLFAVNCQS
jgi:hypothetical protein